MGFPKIGGTILGVPTGLEYFGVYIGVPLCCETTKGTKRAQTAYCPFSSYIAIPTFNIAWESVPGSVRGLRSTSLIRAKPRCLGAFGNIHEAPGCQDGNAFRPQRP